MPLYLAALVAGAVVGLALPGLAAPAEAAINPVLGLLLYATFLAVPFARLRAGLGDVRFLGTVMVLNFVAVPAVVAVLTRPLVEHPALFVGALFVLLTPCVDYVMVFTRLAGGAADRLLAAAPLLMLAQMLLLPVYLWLFVGEGIAQAVDMGPFAQAFVFLIAVPLTAAWLTQLAAEWSQLGQRVMRLMSAAMVPLMMATLFVVVASQIGSVGRELGALVRVVPVYVAFAAVMLAVGLIAGRASHLDVPARRAVVFTGATRNSLVVLPLVLALPGAYGIAPLAVVTQTLVELLVMVTFVRLLPRLVPQVPPTTTRCA